MLKLYRHKLFIKDLKRTNFTNTQYEKYINYLSRLINEDPLPPESRDHLLIGKSKSFRELHIGGDLVVIYKIKNEALSLIRIGSHSQLFEYPLFVSDQSKIFFYLLMPLYSLFDEVTRKFDYNGSLS